MRGMDKRLHRQLTASLRATNDPENWTDHLPLSDLDCSTAELLQV
ncbi:unnamed protein product [Schistocephalus solidus]|uniref:Transposase n=1 Tax=Schistocephalus solidus TaxID=70667 RepID=A0A183SKD2_SCHSO|nr:unnamed protein product [Schistocephalus solidus]